MGIIKCRQMANDVASDRFEEQLLGSSLRLVATCCEGLGRNRGREINSVAMQCGEESLQAGFAEQPRAHPPMEVEADGSRPTKHVAGHALDDGLGQRCRKLPLDDVVTHGRRHANICRRSTRLTSWGIDGFAPENSVRGA